MPAAIFAFINACSQTLPNGAVTLTPVQSPVISGSAIAIGDQIHTTTDLNGVATYNNIVLPNWFQVDFKAVRDTTTYYCYLPTSSVDLNGGDYSVSCSINNGDPTSVFFNLVDFTSHNWAVKKISLSPVYFPNVNDSVITVRDEITLTTDSTGSVTFPNVVPGTYCVTCNGFRRSTVFFICVEPYSGSVNAKDIICLPTQQQLQVVNIPPLTIGTGLTQAEADLIYQHIIVSGSFFDIGVTSALSASVATEAGHAVLSDSSSYAQSASLSDVSILAFTASFVATASNADTATYAFFAESASYAPLPDLSNAGSASWASSSLSSSLTETSSFAWYADSASYATFANTSLSSSLTKTASYAYFTDNATSASLALNAETSSYGYYSETSSIATSASHADYADSSSFASYADSASYAFQAVTSYNSDTASLAVTASQADFAAQADTASYAVYALASGNVPDTASYATQALSASYASNVPDTASYANQAFSSSNADTASFAWYAFSASYAANVPETASYAMNAQSASYVMQAESASYATTYSYVTTGIYEISTSFASASLSASIADYALVAGYTTSALNSDHATSASYAETASYMAGFNAATASYAVSASHSDVADYAFNARSASYAYSSSVQTTIYTIFASASYLAETSSYAQYANYVGGSGIAVSASWASSSYTSSVSDYAATASHAFTLRDNPTLVFKTGNIGPDLKLQALGTPVGGGMMIWDTDGNPYMAIYADGEPIYNFINTHFLQDIRVDGNAYLTASQALTTSLAFLAVSSSAAVIAETASYFTSSNVVIEPQYGIHIKDLAGSDTPGTRLLAITPLGTVCYPSWSDQLDVDAVRFTHAVISGSFTGSFKGYLEGNCVSASYATKSYYAETASYALNVDANTSKSASWASSSYWSVGSDYALLAGVALTCSYNPASSSYAVSSSAAFRAVSASYAGVAFTALSALASLTAGSATYARSASWASSSISSSYSPTALSTSYAATASAFSGDPLYVNGIYPRSSGTGRINVSSSLLMTIFDIPSIDWANYYMYDSNAVQPSLDWNNRVAIDSNGATSINWQNRELWGQWFASGLTSSLDGTASYALAAGNVESASYAYTAATSLNAQVAAIAVTASWARTASYFVGTPASASHADTASYALNATAGSSISSSWASASLSASYALSASEVRDVYTDGGTTIVGNQAGSFGWLGVPYVINGSTIIGATAGATIATSSNAVLIGYRAGGDMYGGDNTEAVQVGFYAGASTANATRSIILGSQAGRYANDNGAVIIGYGAGAGVVNATKAILIGYQASGSVNSIAIGTNITASANQTVLGNTASVSTFIYGPITASTISANLIGSASYALSASWAPSPTDIDTYAISCSWASGSVSSSFATTASYVYGLVQSASYAFSASHAETASYSFFDFGKSGSMNPHTAAVVITGETGSFDAVFYDYCCISGSNKRAGVITATWYWDDGLAQNDINWNEVTTADIGDTSLVTLSVGISGSAVRLMSNCYGTGTDWYVKAVARYV